MNATRRFLILLSLSFSFGGFLFYAGVVVPTGSAILGTTTQGFVTQQVTAKLNIAVAISVALLVWEIVAARRHRGRTSNRLLVASTTVVAACCVVLFLLHGQMDAMLSPEDFTVVDSDKFYGLHRVYLWVSTIQWLFSLWILALVGNTGMASIPSVNRPS